MSQGVALGEDGVCFVCLGTSPSPIQSGCACRGAAGLAHLCCRVQTADALVKQKKSFEWWWTCQTCKQLFTGEMRDGLANAWWSQVCDRAEDDGERLDAAANLAASLSDQGKHDEAEKMEREVLAVEKRVLGAEHPHTLSTAGNLAASLSSQRKYDESEKMEREVLAVKQRVLGAEHPDTLNIAGNLAASLSRQRKYDEAEKMEREVLEVMKRVMGAEHSATLTATVPKGRPCSPSPRIRHATELNVGLSQRL